ncbi:hypothetical protein Tco_0462168 [Tanacetum coccineum]
MLELKLESKEDSTMALELIRFVKKLVAELELKDFDGVLRRIGLSVVSKSFISTRQMGFQLTLLHGEELASPRSNSSCPKANELTIPEQTATGKGTSNPFMAGSLPKTTKPT